MVIYKKCLVDIGKCKGTVTIRGNKVNKIMPDAFAYSKVSTIKVINVKELGEGAFADSNAQKIVLGKTISCLLYTSPSPRDGLLSRMQSSA